MVGYINNINKHCKKDNISTDMKMIRALDPKLIQMTNYISPCLPDMRKINYDMDK